MLHLNLYQADDNDENAQLWKPGNNDIEKLSQFYYTLEPLLGGQPFAPEKWHFKRGQGQKSINLCLY